jgi:hypothetical protein
VTFRTLVAAANPQIRFSGDFVVLVTGDLIMKNLFKFATVALLIGGSVLAASAQEIRGVPGVDYGYPPYVPQTSRGYIAAPATAPRVYENGKLIGQDPDANVRMMLQKDFAFQ